MNCFISYNTEVEKSLGDRVREILLRNNVSPIDIFDISPGDNITTVIEDKIKKSDMFLAVITNVSPNVFYEIGIAKGLNKPIFIVFSKELNIYPSFLNEFLYVRANSSDYDNIDFAFKQFVKNQSKQKQKTNKDRKKHIDNELITLPESWEFTLSDIRKNGTPVKLENYMANLLNSLKTTSRIIEQDKGVDFALWLDDVDPILGNPILLEVKYGNITPETLNMGERQLQNYLLATKSKVGLLLYLDKTGRRFPLGSSLNPLVIRMDLENFLSEIDANKSVVKVILNKRNLMAHGKEGE